MTFICFYVNYATKLMIFEIDEVLSFICNKHFI